MAFSSVTRESHLLRFDRAYAEWNSCKEDTVWKKPSGTFIQLFYICIIYLIKEFCDVCVCRLTDIMTLERSFRPFFQLYWTPALIWILYSLSLDSLQDLQRLIEAFYSKILKNCIQNTAKPYLVHYTTQRYLKLYLDRHVNSQHHWQLAGWSRQVIPPALELFLANGTHPKTSQYLKAITGEPSCNWPQRNNLTSCSVDVSWHKLLEFNQSIFIVFFLAFSRNTN